MRAMMKAQAAIHSHSGEPSASSTRANRMRTIGAYSVKLACARMRRASKGFPPSPCSVLADMRILTQRVASHRFTKAQAAASVSVIGNSMMIFSPFLYGGAR